MPISAEQINKLQALQKAVNQLNKLEKKTKIQESVLEYAKFQMPDYQTHSTYNY